jgi:hypothetical protein
VFAKQKNEKTLDLSLLASCPASSFKALSLLHLVLSSLSLALYLSLSGLSLSL